MTNEFYRQIVHILVGIAAAVSASVLSRQTFLLVWGVLLLLAILLVVLGDRVLRPIMRLLERDDAAFRGKGGIFFLIGVFLTGLLFFSTAPLALLLLAIPDALATILAPLVRSPSLPFNERKSLFGSGVFFASAVLVLIFFSRSPAIILFAFLLTAIESFDYREIPFLDDNLVIPLVAASLVRFL